MGRQIRKSKGKTMKPNFFVFCEGESEVAYISHLRSQYRSFKVTRNGRYTNYIKD